MPIVDEDKTMFDTRLITDIHNAIKRHLEELNADIAISIAERKIEKKPSGRAAMLGIPSITQGFETTFEIPSSADVVSYRLSVVLLSGEDERKKQIEEALEEIAKNPNIKLH